MKSSDKREILVLAREKVSRPGGWIQGMYAARQIRYGPLYLRKKFVPAVFDATAFCASGAISHSATTTVGHRAAWEQFNDVIPSKVAIVHWNDDPNRTQQQVVDAFDKAIASC